MFGTYLTREAALPRPLRGRTGRLLRLRSGSRACASGSTGRDAKNDMRANEEDNTSWRTHRRDVPTAATIIPDVTDLYMIPPHSTEVHADP